MKKLKTTFFRFSKEIGFEENSTGMIRKTFLRLIPAAYRTRIKKAMGMPLTRLHPDWKILRPIGPQELPHLIIDIGSHSGWFFHCWKDWCPKAEIHAFEPSIEACEQSLRLYGEDKNLTVNNIGMGEAAGIQDFFVLDKSRVSNSFLPHNKDTWENIQFETGEVSKRLVPVTTLDAYCAEKSISGIYLIKIDVQGYELKVLKGAKNSLSHVDHVFVESAIRPLYHGAPRFTEVVDFLFERGFHLMAMRAWHRGNHVLMETDMLFRRNDLMPPVNSLMERVTEQIG